jgi:hypothetical protein
MLALILDPRSKSLKLIFFSIGCEHGVSIVEKYDRKSLFPMFLMYYHHLHPLYETESSLTYKIDEDRNLDIFGMVANVNKPTKDLVN